MNKTALISAVADMKIVNNGKLAEVQANDAKLAQIELVELDFESRTALDKQRMELSVRNAEYAKLATANDKLRSEAQLMSGLIAYMSTIISKPDFDDEIADAIYNVLVKHRMVEHKAKYSLLKLYKSKQYQVYIDGVEARRVEIDGKPALEAGDVDDTINFTINGDLESTDGTFNVMSDEGYDITIQFMKGL